MHHASRIWKWTTIRKCILTVITRFAVIHSFIYKPITSASVAFPLLPGHLFSILASKYSKQRENGKRRPRVTTTSDVVVLKRTTGSRERAHSYFLGRQVVVSASFPH